jgi:hypothetical protein
MAVPSSGNEITLHGLKTELENSNYTATPAVGYNTETVMSELLANNNLNLNSTNRPSSNSWNANGEYQAGQEFKFSDFYSYDNDEGFKDSKAVSKSTTTGSSNAITFTDTDDTFNFTSSSAWTISLWIKAGWTSSLNTNIHFIIGQKENATYQLSDMVKILYNEANNRIECRYGNKTTSSNAWYKNAGWLFHSPQTSPINYNTARVAAGLHTGSGVGGASTYWSATNRGYVNSNDFTMITITKSTTDSPDAMTLYWNANSCGASAIDTTSGSGSPAMSSTNNRLWSLGSNGVHGASNDQIKCGEVGSGAATLYNDVTIWNKELSSSEVTELWNSGAAMHAQMHSAKDNLIGYWRWEGNGNASVSNDNFTISGDSALVDIN